MQKKFLSACLFTCIFSDAADKTIGIIAGNDSTPSSYVALINSAGVVSAPLSAPATMLNAVSMNASGMSAIGGSQQPNAQGYIGLISPTGDVRSTILSNFTEIFSCEINAAGYSVYASAPGNPVAFRADPQGNISNYSAPTTGGFGKAAINDSGLAVFGGNGPMVGSGGALLPGPNSVVDPIFLNAFFTDITDAAINAFGFSILGGNTPICYIYDSAGINIASISLPGGATSSLAINNSNTTLISSLNGAASSLTLSTSLGQNTIPLTGDSLPATTSGGLSVDLNGAGYGIVGGYDATNNVPYAAFITPTGVIQNISGLPDDSMATIASVSINSWGVALLGGTPDGTSPYAALVTPWGGFMPLSVNSATPINSVSLRNFFPFTKQLHQLLGTVKAINGNSRIFGEYITQEAPEKIIYFIPSVFAGTLSDALISTAPTRNAISLFTADSNLLFLSRGLSVHLRNHRHFRTHTREEIPIAAINHSNQAQEIAFFTEETPYLLEASQQEIPPEQLPACGINQDAKTAAPRCTGPAYSLWFETIGAFASQSEQSQTPGFQPWMGGAILACDTNTNAKSLAGGGIAYTFTHISENGNQGSSRINQEYLFGYATWANERLYFDGALWFGLFQIHQVRNIHLTGFDFQSISSPHGWQLSPHVEFGYDHAWQFGKDKKNEFILDPFVMVDWVNAWQAAYEERGKGPFNAGQQAHYSSVLRSEIGLRFYETLLFSTWRCIFEQKGSYVNKAPFGVGQVTAFLVGSPGSFTVETLSDAQNLGAVEVALIAEPLDHAYPYGSFSYQGEFGSSFQSHQLIAEASWDF